MTVKEVKILIQGLSEQLKIPFAYYQFPQKTSPPFLTYQFPDINDMFADGINYQKINRLDIYFCSDEKEFASEAIIENFLNTNGLAYFKEEIYIENEMMWQIKYSTEVLINE